MASPISASPEVYTVRMGIFAPRLYSPESLVALYGPALKAAGFTAPQYPTVAWPPTPTKLTANDPSPGFRTITINLPPFPEITQTRDLSVPFEQDPSALLAETGRAYASVFTWNLCAPSNSAPGADLAGTLRNIFRSVKEPGTAKLSPIVKTWEETPQSQAGYPEKSAKYSCSSTPAAAVSGTGKGVAWASVAALVLYALNKR